MERQKRVRWPVRWTKMDEELIEEASKYEGLCPTHFVRNMTIKKARTVIKKRVHLIWPELMIWGFCIENLLKGLYAKKQCAGLLKNKQAKPLNDDGTLGKRDHFLENWCERDR